MSTGTQWGYMGRFCGRSHRRLDTGRTPGREAGRDLPGGAGFGAEYLYREVPPGVAWDSPENRIIMVRVRSANGSFGDRHVLSRHEIPMTNLAVSTRPTGIWRLLEIRRL